MSRLRHVFEAWRYRRTAYSSGRKETIGYEKPRFGGPKRKVKKRRSSLNQTSMKHKPWRRY